MPKFFSRQFHSILIILGLTGFLIGKDMGTEISSNQLLSMTETGPSPVLAQAIFAGPAPGLAADTNILGVFHVYSLIKDASLSNKEHSLLWNNLKTYLNQASLLDPYFYDTYRLTSGLLAFQDEHARDAIGIMEYGSQYRTWDWETPMIAGFLAYELLQDNRLAFNLMKLSTSRPDVPPLAISLAARFLAKDKGEDAGIQFLQYMKSIMPKAYSKPIDDRIEKLKKEWEVKQ